MVLPPGSGDRTLRASLGYQPDQRLDAGGVELTTGKPLKLLDGLPEAAPRTVGARLAHRRERIRSRDDPGPERGRGTLEAVGVATPVPALVVPAHDAKNDLMVQGGRQQRLAEQWVQADHLGLGVVE